MSASRRASCSSARARRSAAARSVGWLRHGHVVAAVPCPEEAREARGLRLARQHLARVDLRVAVADGLLVRKARRAAVAVVLEHAGAQRILQPLEHGLWYQKLVLCSKVRVVFQDVHDLLAQPRVLVILAGAGGVAQAAEVLPLDSLEEREQGRGLVPAALLVVAPAPAHHLQDLHALALQPLVTRLEIFASALVVLRRAELARARARVELEVGLARQHALGVALVALVALLFFVPLVVQRDPALARAQRAALGTRVVGSRVAAREPPPAGAARARQARRVARGPPPGGTGPARSSA
jgi:hypothetical protein